jgi:hypothetical protein
LIEQVSKLHQDTMSARREIPIRAFKGRTFVAELGKNVPFAGNALYNDDTQVLTVIVFQGSRMFTVLALWKPGAIPRVLASDGVFPDCSSSCDLIASIEDFAEILVLRLDCDDKPEFWLEVTLEP